MPTFEIEPIEGDSHYRVIIGHYDTYGEDTRLGRLYVAQALIVPPANLSYDFLETVTEDTGVRFSNQVHTDQGTSLWFEYSGKPEESEIEGNLAIRGAFSVILAELGRTSPDSFTKHWDRL